MSFVYETKGMPFRRLGPSGLRVPLFSLGAWLTYGATVVGDPVKECIKTALEHGINMFDTAEGYAEGKAELEMGRVFKELDVKRTDIIVSTKIFWGGKGPNDTGLSRKHIIEGTKKCLERLQLDYVDVIFAHRPDHSVPMEEIVRAFNFVIDQGWAFYWATSEWSAHEIEEAYHVASKLGLIAPIAEQCQHNMFHRERPEKEYAPLYKNYSIGTTVWSGLARGLLTGKYNNGIPSDSRFAVHADFFKTRLEKLQSEEGQREIEKVKQLSEFAEKELGCGVQHLALAWLAVNPNTSTVILGASKPEQIVDNLKALDVIPKLTSEVLEKIEHILENKPTPWTTYGRASLDTSVRFNPTFI
ncbi:voltage-gated potassium channel beta-2 subunit [Dichomitus squalens]|uniref:Voltage-gated potassium channel beta-2 subunit n=1 Tax=Dichomitus squalens TaxID=114155 RepID=A0A4Q9NYE6_9APHY|nr:voltage-gated potassium channel beta-2 subunit [Dichomitus squalens]TBU46145.1 voltage-gated potassium channel beta-2 subunit [Dichomitus squalens]